MDCSSAERFMRDVLMNRWMMGTKKMGITIKPSGPGLK